MSWWSTSMASAPSRSGPVATVPSRRCPLQMRAIAAYRARRRRPRRDLGRGVGQRQSAPPGRARDDQRRSGRSSLALIDGNSFYCSCERVFDPRLQAPYPLSCSRTTTGARSPRTSEAKMHSGSAWANPGSKCARCANVRDVRVFSSNYALYGDMSGRGRMQIYRDVQPKRVEIYSIDEILPRSCPTSMLPRRIERRSGPPVDRSRLDRPADLRRHRTDQDAGEARQPCSPRRRRLCLWQTHSFRIGSSTTATLSRAIRC